jgi:5-methylcytosine-specific restriction endonuclease McrA
MGCRRYVAKAGCVPLGLGWCCDDNCRFEAQRRMQEGVKRATSPREHKTRTEPTAAQKTKVRERDGNCCRFCGTPANHVHHIVLRAQGGGHHPRNLITLCLKCHETVHADTHFWQPILQEAIELQYDSDEFLSVPQVLARVTSSLALEQKEWPRT